MKKNLKSIIDDIITKNYLIEDGLYNGYINTTGLALMIQPYIKETLWEEKVSFDSIKMALFRASKNLKIPKKVKIFSAKNLFIKKDLFIISADKEQKDKQEAIRSIEKVKGHYLSKIEWNKEISVIYEEFYQEQMEKLVPNKEDIVWKSNLTLIGVMVPDGTQDTPGLVYNMSKQLMFYWVNITQIIQTQNEFAIVVEKEYMQDAIYVLSNI